MRDGRTDGRTDGQTDRRTDGRSETSIPPQQLRCAGGIMIGQVSRVAPAGVGWFREFPYIIPIIRCIEKRQCHVSMVVSQLGDPHEGMNV